MASTLPINQAMTPGLNSASDKSNFCPVSSVSGSIMGEIMENSSSSQFLCQTITHGIGWGFFFLHILKPVSLGSFAIFPLAASITFLKIIKTHHLVYCDYWTCRGSCFPLCLSQRRKLNLRGNETMPNVMQCRAEI